MVEAARQLAPVVEGSSSPHASGVNADSFLEILSPLLASSRTGSASDGPGAAGGGAVRVDEPVEVSEFSAPVLVAVGLHDPAVDTSGSSDPVVMADVPPFSGPGAAGGGAVRVDQPVGAPVEVLSQPPAVVLPLEAAVGHVGPTAEVAQQVPSGGVTVTGASTVSTQIADAVGEMATFSDGTQRISLKLHPEELGEVQLEVAVREGRLDLAIASTTEAGREAVSRQLPEIRAALSDLGFSTGEMFLTDGDAPAERGDSGDSQERPRRTSVSTGAPRPVTGAIHDGSVDLNL